VHPAGTFTENNMGGREAGAPGQWLLLAFVQLYRVFLSPFLGGACKFYPSCSQYAQEAIAVHGAKQGSVLALKRLGRCRPFTKGGFDPVPDAKVGYENPDTKGKPASGAEAPFSPACLAGLGPHPSKGLVAASRDFHDYSDAEWLRSVSVTKELVQ